MSVHMPRRPTTIHHDPTDPPKPHGPGVSLGEVFGAVAQQVQHFADQEKKKIDKTLNQARDAFDTVVNTRVAFDPHTQVDVNPGGVHAHADGSGAGIDVKFPSIKVKDLPNFIITLPG